MGQAHLSAPLRGAIIRAYEAKRRKTTSACRAAELAARSYFWAVCRAVLFL